MEIKQVLEDQPVDALKKNSNWRDWQNEIILIAL